MNPKQLITSTNGKFFSVTFIKKNGERRRMTARVGVKKNLKGGDNPAKNYDNLVVVWDVQKSAYRMINLDTLEKFKCGKLVLTK